MGLRGAAGGSGVRLVAAGARLAGSRFLRGSLKILVFLRGSPRLAANSDVTQRTGCVPVTAQLRTHEEISKDHSGRHLAATGSANSIFERSSQK